MEEPQKSLADRFSASNPPKMEEPQKSLADRFSTPNPLKTEETQKSLADHFSTPNSTQNVDSTTSSVSNCPSKSSETAEGSSLEKPRTSQPPILCALKECNQPIFQQNKYCAQHYTKFAQRTNTWKRSQAYNSSSTLERLSNSSTLSSSSSNWREWSGSEWVDVLRREVSPNKLVGLLHVLQRRRSFAGQFLRCGGLELLAKILHNVTIKTQPQLRDTIRLSCLRCLEVLLNVKNILKHILTSIQLIDCTVDCISSATLALQIQALHVLTTVTWLASDPQIIIEALSHDATANCKVSIYFDIISCLIPVYPNAAPDKSTASKFSCNALGKSLRELKSDIFPSFELATGAMMLINILLSCTGNLESRVSLRRELVEEPNSILSKLASLQDCLDELRSSSHAAHVLSEENDSSKGCALQSQLDLFDKEHINDQKATSRDGVDFSDPDAVFQFLKETTREDRFIDRFMHILHMFLTVPRERSIGDRMWTTLENIVYAATISDTNSDSTHYLTYQELLVLLKEKEEADAMPSSHWSVLEDTREKQRQQISQLTQDLTALQLKHDVSESKVSELTRSVRHWREKATGCGSSNMVNINEEVPLLTKTQSSCELNHSPLRLSNVSRELKETRSKFLQQDKDLQNLRRLNKLLIVRIKAAENATKQANATKEQIIRSEMSINKANELESSSIFFSTEDSSSVLPHERTSRFSNCDQKCVNEHTMILEDSCSPSSAPCLPTVPQELGSPSPPPPPMLEDFASPSPPPPPPMLEDFASPSPPPPAMLEDLASPSIPLPPTLEGISPISLTGNEKPVQTVASTARLKPKVKMKPFHWTLVPSMLSNLSCWKEWGTGDLSIDFETLESNFCSQAPKPAISAVQQAKEPVKPQKIALIDGKRAYNVDISLSRFRMSHADIRDAIINMNPDILTEDRVEALAKLAPSMDELDLVRSYAAEGSDVSTLGNTESFFLVVSSIPRLSYRLKYLLFKLQFSNNLTTLEKAVTVLENATQELRSSRMLKEVFSVILACGNYMNANTRKGGATGFKLSALGRLASTKSVDGKLSLLDYVVECVLDKFPEKPPFPSEMPSIAEAKRIDISNLSSEIKQFATELADYHKQLGSYYTSKEDRFPHVMQEFYDKSKLEIECIERRIDDFGGNGASLAVFFGSSNLPVEKLFEVFYDFSQQYMKALKAIEQRRMIETRNKAREERANVLEAEKKTKIAEKAVPAKARVGVVSQVMCTLSKMDAAQLMSEIRRRQTLGPAFEEDDDSDGSSDDGSWDEFTPVVSRSSSNVSLSNLYDSQQASPSIAASSPPAPITNYLLKKQPNSRPMPTSKRGEIKALLMKARENA